MRLNIKDFNHLNNENISRLPDCELNLSWVIKKKHFIIQALQFFFPFYRLIPYWSINILLMEIHHCIKYKGYCSISVGALGFIGLFATLNVFFTLKENSNCDIWVMRHIMVKKSNIPSYIDWHFFEHVSLHRASLQEMPHQASQVSSVEITDTCPVPFPLSSFCFLINIFSLNDISNQQQRVQYRSRWAPQ